MLQFFIRTAPFNSHHKPMHLLLDAMTGEKTKVRKVKELAQGHLVMKWPGWASEQFLRPPGPGSCRSCDTADLQGSLM